MIKNKIKDVLLCFATDPYQPLEKRICLTRKVLKVLIEEEVPFSILTKSNLVLRDADLLRGYPRCRVGLTITTMNDNVRKLWEPYSSSIEERITTVKTLHDMGIKTWVSVEPILDNSYSDIISELCEYVDFWVFGKLNYYRTRMNWQEVAERIQAMCEEMGLRYLIKQELAIFLRPR